MRRSGFAGNDAGFGPLVAEPQSVIVRGQHDQFDDGKERYAQDNIAHDAWAPVVCEGFARLSLYGAQLHGFFADALSVQEWEGIPCDDVGDSCDPAHEGHEGNGARKQSVNQDCDDAISEWCILADRVFVGGRTGFGFWRWVGCCFCHDRAPFFCCTPDGFVGTFRIQPWLPENFKWKVWVLFGVLGGG